MTRQYILTERAHMMCPNMHFGIKIRLKAAFDKERADQSISMLINAHPFLHSRISKEKSSGRFYYDAQDINIIYILKDDASNWIQDYIELTGNGWNVLTEPLIKIILYPMENSFDVLLIAHHLLGDGRAVLNLACEFAESYVNGREIPYVEEQLISSAKDLPAGCKLSFISRKIITDMNQKWAKEQHIVSYEEYLAFEKSFLQNNPVLYSEETVSSTQMNELVAQCKQKQISLNDYLLADMLSHEQANRIVIAADIRKQLSCYKEGAMGNYASAMSIQCSSSHKDIFSLAKKIHKQVRHNLQSPQKLMLILACYLCLIPELIDAAAISVLGDFDSKAGQLLGSIILGYRKRNGYSITNLGNINSDCIEEAIFIPPASPANRKTMGVVSVNKKMKKCTAIY